MSVPGKGYNPNTSNWRAAGRLARIQQMQREASRLAAEAMQPRPSGVAAPTQWGQSSPLPPATVVEPPPAATPAQVLVPAPEGTPPRAPYGSGSRFADESGQISAVRLDGSRFLFADGLVVDVEGNVLGRMDSGDLTGTSATPADNLDASAVEIDEGPSGGSKNLKPNQKKIDQLERLKEDIWQATTPAPQESLKQGTVRRLAKRVEGLSEEDRAELAARLSRDPAEAQERLDRLAALAGADPEGRAAAQIDNAAQAIEAAGKPRPRSADAAPSLERAAATRARLMESMPDGDWGALARAFGELDHPQRVAVIERLSAAGATTPLHRFYPAGADNPSTADASTARGFFSRMLDGNAPTPTINPNQMALMLSPVNAADDLLMQIDAAKRVGNADLQNSLSTKLRESMQSGDLTREQVDEAAKRFTLRRQVEQELRNQIIGANPDYATAQSRMLASNLPPAQPPAIPPGARSVELSSADEVPAPQGADAAAAMREREEQAATYATGGGLSRDERISMLGLDPNDPQALRQAPLAFKGRDGRTTPFESRSQGDRAGDLSSLDRQAIEQAEELQQAINSAQDEMAVRRYELRLAQIGKTSRNPSSTDANIAAAQKRVEMLQDTLRALYAREDQLFPPRLIDERTGAVQRAPAAMLEDHSLVPEGFVIERGRRANTDSWLNRPGQQETFDRILMTGAGMQPRGASNLSRSSDGMSALERAFMRDEAVDMFGDDAAALMDEVDPNWSVDPSDLSEPSAPLKTGRLGGAQQPSRARDAVLSVYGGRNPLQLKNPRTKTEFTADEVVEDLFKKSRVFNDPESANTQMAKERWKAFIQREFGESGKPVVTRIEDDGRVVTEEVSSTSASPAPASAPEAVGGTSQDPDSIPREGVSDMRGLGRGVPNQRGVVEQLTPAQRQAEYEQKLEAFQRLVGRKGYAATGESSVLTPRTQRDGQGAPVSSPDEPGFPVTIDASGIPVAVKPATPRATRDFSKPETVLSPEEQALLSSNMPIDDPEVIDAPDKTPAAAGGRQSAGSASAAEVVDAPNDAESYTPQQIESLWRQWFSQWKPRSMSLPDGAIWEMGVRPGMTFEEWAEETLDGKGLRNRVPSANGRSSRQVKVIGVDGGEVVDAADDAAAATARSQAPNPKPEAARPAGADGEDVIDAPDDPKPKPASDGGGSEPPDGTTPKGAEGDRAPTPSEGTTPSTAPSKGGLPWKRGLLAAGAGIAGLSALSRMGQPTLDGPIDIPGGMDGEGRRPYIPVGLDVTPGMAAGAGGESEADAIERALARLRGARMAPSRPSYNTMFNYTYRS